MPLGAAGTVEGFEVRVRRVACAGAGAGGAGGAPPAFEAVEHVELSGAFVPGGSEALVNAPFAAGSAHPAADQFFLVDAGCYDVTVVPVDEVGSPTTGCQAATVGGVEVLDGETSEITVVIQCNGGAPQVGALDVIAAINRPPFLQHVEYRPSKMNPACAPVMICARASDADDDPLDISWEHTTGDAFSVGPDLASLEGGPGDVTSCIQLVAAAPGYHVVTVIVHDMAWSGGELVTIESLLAAQGQPHRSRASLELPLHIGQARAGGESCLSPPDPPVCDAPTTDCGRCDPHRARPECACHGATNDCTVCDPNRARAECVCHGPTHDCSVCDPHRARPECDCAGPTSDCTVCDPNRGRAECACAGPTNDCTVCDPNRARPECGCAGPTDDCTVCDPHRDRPECECPAPTNDCTVCDPNRHRAACGCAGPTDDCTVCDPDRHRAECACAVPTNDCGVCDPNPDRDGCDCDLPTTDCGVCDPNGARPECTCERDTNDCGRCDLDRSGCGPQPPQCLGGDVGPGGDCDGDRVPNGREDEEGTDKFDPDTDDDFIADGEEWGNPAGEPVDTDGDGTIDALDDDSDDDGMSDIEEAGDTSLLTPAPDTNGNGIPEYQDPDRDRDTISDPVDNCPTTSNVDQSDRDGDGVGDVCEKCPDNRFVDIRLGSPIDADCGQGLTGSGQTLALQGGGGCAVVPVGSTDSAPDSGRWLLLVGLIGLAGRRASR